MSTSLILKIIGTIHVWVPIFCVFFIKKNKAIAYTLGSISYAITAQLEDYYFCIENPNYYCPPENHELFTQIIQVIIGLLYCLIVELIIWGLKTLRDYLKS